MLAPSSIWLVLVALLLAGTMGFAIQRGATCTVAAVDEWLSARRATRMVSIVEASILVAVGLLVADALGVLDNVPVGYPVTIWVVIGGALLGLGAFVNQACVFGAIARLGCGEWAYLATPIGFYAGCVLVGYVAPYIRHTAPLPLATSSPLFAAGAPLAVAATLVLLGIALYVLTERGKPARGLLAERVWSPRVATAVIGITFLFLLLLAGAWAYTDVLAELARGMHMNLVVRGLLLLMLFAGALVGGWSAGRFASRKWSMRQVVRCFVGGAMMGVGGLMIPGSNDGLVLLGMPLLWPYAWVAFATMCAAIAMAMMAARRLRRAHRLATPADANN